MSSIAAAASRTQTARWPGYHRWILAGLATLFFAIRIYHGSVVCLDGDEIFSVGVSSHSWSQLIWDVGKDSIHPPLFYFLLKIWTGIFGDSLFWLRILPALFAALSIVPAVLLAREFQLRPWAIDLTVALGVFHPLMLYYSQHVRMYTLLMLCALTSLYLFHRAMQSGRYGMLTVVNIVATHAHYYGWLVLGLQGLYLIVWKRDHVQKMIVSGMIVLVAYIPWILWVGKFVIAKGGLHSNLEWIQKPGVTALAWFFVDLLGFGDLPVLGRWAVACLAVTVLTAGFLAWRERACLRGGHFQQVARFLLFFVLGSATVAFAVSRLGSNSVWGHRHMVYLAFPTVMLVAAAYQKLNSLPVRIAGALAFTVWAGTVVQHQVKGDDKKTPFDRLVVEMLSREKNNPEPVTFYSVDKYLHYPVRYYTNVLKEGRITGFGAPIRQEDRSALTRQAALLNVIAHATPIDQVTGGHFWVGYSSAWTGARKPEQILEQRGCRTGPGLTVKDRYHTSTVFPVWCDRLQPVEN